MYLPTMKKFAFITVVVLSCTLPTTGGHHEAVIQFETLAKVAESGMVLRGPDARHQLVVSHRDETGQMHDVTGTVQYQTAPEGLVAIDATGQVTPLANGQVTVTAVGPGEQSAAISLTVESMIEAPPVNFINQVVPIFTKMSCNSGGCHGKSGGQNGFALSLLGFEPQEDYDHLVHEARGRRLFPAAPDNSLLLLKSTNIMPHGGGQRIGPDSHDYRVIRRWIEQGMPYGRAEDAKVVGIEVVPNERIMTTDGRQQLGVYAHMSDGRITDVTHAAHYDTNDKELGNVDKSGLVDVTGRPGDVVIMVRYQEHASVYRAAVPLGVPVEDVPEPANFIDDHVYTKLRMLGMPPSPVCDDATFLRRVTLDIAGRLPTPEESAAFFDSSDPDKRGALIDRLVDSPDYADYFANKWSAVLRNKSQHRVTYVFHNWIRQSLYENMPYDQFVRGIIAAAGDVDEHPPVAWYRQVDQPKKQMEDTAQLFLGVRIQCAQCHHHPYEKWAQQDYYGLTAFFTQVARKDSATPGEPRIFHRRGEASAENPKTKEKVKPTPLGDETLELSPEADPRQALADWLARADNPFFARMLVNRYWKHFFNRGLVDPEDDMRVTNPASNPQLLDALAAAFIESDFDLKQLVRTICRSNTYQFNSTPNEHNRDDKSNFARYYPRRLNAEVLLDAIDTVTGGHTQFAKLPPSTRAVQIPDAAFDSYFLTLFGKPKGGSACECERTSDANLAQSLHMLNSGDIRNKVTSGRASSLALDQQRDELQKLTELYMLAYSRPPAASELSLAMEHLASASTYDKREAYEDIVWALINTKEFMFNH